VRHGRGAALADGHHRAGDLSPAAQRSGGGEKRAHAPAPAARVGKIPTQGEQRELVTAKRRRGFVSPAVAVHPPRHGPPPTTPRGDTLRTPALVCPRLEVRLDLAARYLRKAEP